MTEQTAETTTVTATETVEIDKPAEVDWKAKAREWEKRAKANADAASKLTTLEEAQKTEAQKLADTAEQHRRDAEKARADLIRMQVARRYQIPESDLDLLGDGDEEQIEAKAKRLAELHAAATSDTPARPRSDVDQGPRGAQTLPVTDEMERHLRSLLGG
jgi:hypothetical protein